MFNLLDSDLTGGKRYPPFENNPSQAFSKVGVQASSGRPPLKENCFIFHNNVTCTLKIITHLDAHFSNPG